MCIHRLFGIWLALPKVIAEIMGEYASGDNVIEILKALDLYDFRDMNSYSADLLSQTLKTEAYVAKEFVGEIKFKPRDPYDPLESDRKGRIMPCFRNKFMDPIIELVFLGPMSDSSCIGRVTKYGICAIDINKLRSVNIPYIDKILSKIPMAEMPYERFSDIILEIRRFTSDIVVIGDKDFKMDNHHTYVRVFDIGRNLYRRISSYRELYIQN